jgi:hypothetical protein
MAKVDEKERAREEKRRRKELKEQERRQEKERKKMIKQIEKRAGALQKYSVTLEEQGMFEAYCFLRSHEIQLSMEDQYDFVKFMLKMQELKLQFEQIGILNLVPVGSTVNKIVRKDNYMIDVILNYNKTSMLTPGTQDV